VLVHVAWNIGDVKVGIALIGELLELSIEGFLKDVSGM
jgi:hypothetical protein